MVAGTGKDQLMARRRHTPEQIIRKLAEGQRLLAEGKDVAEVCREFQIAESTWARWLNQYGGMKADDAKRLKELEGENARLKKLLAEAELDKEMLKGVGRGKLLTPNRKRAAVVMLRDRFGVSERRACRVVGQHRSTQRLAPPAPPDDEAELRQYLPDFARRRPRWGWRRAAVALRRDGWAVNNKRVRRLWRDEGLQVPQKAKKKRLTGIGAHVGAMSLIAPDALWALDFQFDHLIDARQVKILNVIDEFTREALACDVEHSITADDVVATLDRLAAERGHREPAQRPGGPLPGSGRATRDRALQRGPPRGSRGHDHRTHRSSGLSSGIEWRGPTLGTVGQHR